MVLKIAAEAPPLLTDDSGTVRVGGSRLTLDVFVGHFNQGLGARDLGECFPSLSLADVHAVIAYYLRHREEVDAYLRARAEQAERAHREFAARFRKRVPSKDELLARWEQKTASSLAAGGGDGTPPGPA